MPSEDTFTKVSVDHDSGSVVAVTFDGNDGKILRIEKATFDPTNIKTPDTADNGVSHY